MRALVVTLILAVIVAFLTGALVTIGGVRVNETRLIALGGGLFMVAVLFAAISAIGPKFRPTPALTAIMAGTSAATFTAALILAAHLHLTGGEAASFRTSAPAKPAPEKAEPVPEARDVEPELPEPPPDAFVAIPPADEQPSGDVSDDEVPMDESPADDVPAGGPGSETAALPPAADTHAAAPVPIPVPRPQSPSETPEKLGPGDTYTLSNQTFDSSGATSVSRAGAPPSQARIIPPLPRSRPCGAGGPPCP
jgi:hypothetical protein